MIPKIPITDRRFQYTPSSKTDIRKTFDRIRKEQENERETDGVQPSNNPFHCVNSSNLAVLRSCSFSLLGTKGR